MDGVFAGDCASWVLSITRTTVREYAYDRDSAVGKLDKALDEPWQRAGLWLT